MPHPRRPLPARTWWLRAHAVLVVGVVAGQWFILTTSLALPLPAFVGVVLVQGLGAVLGSPWSLAYLVPLVPPADDARGHLLVLVTPLLVNLAVHLLVVQWLIPRRVVQRALPRRWKAPQVDRR